MQVCDAGHRVQKLHRVVSSRWMLSPVARSCTLSVGCETASGARAEPLSPDSGAPERGLPLKFERHTDDLDAVVKHKTIRALVLYHRTGFFYVNGRPEGIYESLRAFSQFRLLFTLRRL